MFHTRKSWAIYHKARTEYDERHCSAELVLYYHVCHCIQYLSPQYGFLVYSQFRPQTKSFMRSLRALGIDLCSRALCKGPCVLYQRLQCDSACDSVAVCVRYMLFSFSSPTCPGYEVMYALYRVYGTDYISMSCYKSHLSILQQNASSGINWAQNNYKIVKIHLPHFVHSSPACCYGAFTRKDPPSSTSLCSVFHMVQWCW